MKAIIFLSLFVPLLSIAQTGPGGVGTNDGTSNLELWYQGDAGLTLMGTDVSAWADQSGNGNDLQQVTAANRPTQVASAALNNQNVINFNSANNEFFTSTVTGPNSNELTAFIVANGASYQSILRWQNTGFVVYPYEVLGAANGFISSSDGGSTGGIDNGLVANVNNIGVARYIRNTASGMQTFRNGALIAQRNSANAILPNDPLSIGRHDNGAAGGEYANCDVGEIAVYHRQLNEAELIIVNNYLSAKFNVILDANDVYTQDNAGNGNYDHDVAGIGRFNAANIHDDARGSGIVRILNPAGLGDDEFLMWGHDNGVQKGTESTDVPTGVQARFDRVWRVSESSTTGTAVDVGAIDIRFDLTGLVVVAADLRLLVDTDNDGAFDDETPITGATDLGGGIFQFSGVTAIQDGLRFTLGTTSSLLLTPSFSGPGGVGGTDGTSNLVLWLDANAESATPGTTVTTWNDQSGTGNHFTAGNGAVYNSAVTNGYPAFTFNGTTHYFERAFNANLNTNTFSLFTAARVQASNLFKALVSNRDDPPGAPTRGFILYASPTSDDWQFWTGNVTTGWDIATNNTSTAGAWTGHSLRYQNSTNGKIMNINGTTDVTTTHTMTANAINPYRVGAGANETVPDFYFPGDIGEIIQYNTVVNEAQEIIVNNYLSAKYDYALTANDVYTQDDAGNGNYDHDVAGIGRINATNSHNDAQGTGIVRILNPTDLGDNEFLMWGHDNGAQEATESTDVPTGIQTRFRRVWRVSESSTTGTAVDVGAIDIQFDLTGLGAVTADLRLLVDTDNDGVFNDETPITGAVDLGNDIFGFNGITAIQDGLRFTLGTTSSLLTLPPTGLGGVGANDGTSNLELWYQGDAGLTLVGTDVSAWADQSGNGNDIEQVTAANRPTQVASAALNNQNVINFNSANDEFFSSTVTGPNSNGLTAFIVANGASYQSILRWQNAGFIVYPYEFQGAANGFIISSDGTSTGGINNGLVANVNNIGVARYLRNTTNGMQTFRNGALVAQRNSVDVILPNEPLTIGRFNGGGGFEYANCDVGEIAVYHRQLNEAELIIVNNYLSAKFNVTLGANDVYAQDDAGNGNYDHDVAGIGRVNAANSHDDAQGTGMVRILNPTDLGDDEFLMWGHDNGAQQGIESTDVPTGVQARLGRVWRASESSTTGTAVDVGAIDLRFDLTGLGAVAADLRLLVDTDNDGAFNDETPITGATDLGGGIFQFSGVTAIQNGLRFTVGTASSLLTPSFTGPGGVGSTDGTSNLDIWLKGSAGVETTGGVAAEDNDDVTFWRDQSGNNNDAEQNTVANKPTLDSTGMGGQPSINFSSAGNQFLATTYDFQEDFHVFIVASSANTNWNDFGYLFSSRDNNGLIVHPASGSRSMEYISYDNAGGIQFIGGITPVTAGDITVPNIYHVGGDHSLGNLAFDLGLNNSSITGNLTITRGISSNATINIGRDNCCGGRYQDGQTAEIIYYNTRLNTAQRIIVANYLAAKYGITLAANDVYTQDNAGNGNYDHEVAGIGRINAANIHDDAQGTGIVRILNPTGLGDNEFLMWGHDNGTQQATETTDVPTGVEARFARVWRVSETGDVGAIDIRFEITGLGSVTASDLRLLVDVDNNGNFNNDTPIAGATNLGSDIYQFAGVTAIADGLRFTLGTMDNIQTPLPIVLVNFSASATNKGNVRLDWQTASETNNDFFTVERSGNATDWEKVTIVKGAGNSSGLLSYSAVDKNPYLGTSYYRLKQTDFDGQFEYSNVKSVNLKTAEPSNVRLYPNPTSDQIIIVGDEIELTEIKIFNTLGQNVSTITTILHNEKTVTVDMSNLSTGMYYIKTKTTANKVYKQ